eukprot:TRINITY_DN10518_c0_g1_i21.p1 TRINITY_DN10518_c0_g1~~TRINITY_DN10518_c0_g1_i21.p1  ORF type:complete len:376 (+),score=54.97 TRINITY_DN10518_c0_g1_i21:1076-2203(+)
MCSKAPKFLAFKERPKEGVRLLVKRNVEAMVKSALEDIATWSLNSEVRYTFLLQLYSIILCCEDGIVPFTGKITSTLYRFVADEDKKMSSVACEIAYALGFYSTPEVFVPIFINDFQQKEESTEENAPSTQITRCAILVLLEELKGTVSEDIAKHVGTLIDAIDREIPNLDPTLIPALLLLVHKLVEATGEGCKEFRPLFFRLVLSLGGVCDLKEAKDFVSGIMEKLSVNCGLKDAHELFSNELESALEEYKKTYKTWDKNSLERFAFDALVRNSNTAVLSLSQLDRRSLGKHNRDNICMHRCEKGLCASLCHSQAHRALNRKRGSAKQYCTARNIHTRQDITSLVHVEAGKTSGQDKESGYYLRYKDAGEEPGG